MFVMFVMGGKVANSTGLLYLEILSRGEGQAVAWHGTESAANLGARLGATFEI